MNTEQWLDEFSKHLEFERGQSKATVTSYYYSIRGCLAYLEERGVEPGAASSAIISAYVAMRASSGLKPASVFALGMALKSFYRFLVLKGYAASDPTKDLTLPQPRRRLPDPLTEEEVTKLLEFPAGRYVTVRDRAILELLYCGLRISEALTLDKDHIHNKEGFIRITGKGDRERLVPIGRQAQQALERYLEKREGRFPEKSGAVFLTQRGEKLSRGSFWLRLKVYARWAGIQKRVYPHLLRHAYASHVLYRGMDLRSLQEAMGHRQLSSTSVYLHTTPQQLIEAYQRTHPRA